MDKMAFVFLDSNINLHLIQTDPTALDYLNSIISNGFIQVVTRSTRVQGQSHSLIDHILINKNFNENCSGTLVSDLSDHFINFQQLDSTSRTNDHKTLSSRKFSPENMDRFKTLLSGTDWINVTDATHVDIAFDAFWAEFKQLYDLCFPLITTKFNRNIHKINGYRQSF
jgi:hypothetical protein